MPFFLFTMLVSLCYIALANRRADVFTVAIFSSALFLLPTFFGQVPGFNSMEPLPVYEEMYLSFTYFSISLLIAAIVYDFTFGSRTFLYANKHQWNNKPFLHLLSTPAIIFSLYFWLANDTYIFTTKRDLLENHSLLYTVYDSLSVIGLVALFLIGTVFSYSFAVLIGITDIAMGNRSAIAIAGIAVVLLVWRRQPKGRFVRKHILAILLGGLGVLGLMMSKTLYSFFRTGNLGEFLDNFSSSAVETISVGAEFIRTQYIFAEIVRSGYETDGGHLLRAPLSFFPFPRSAYTTPSSEFNDLFQPALFPDITFGLAYNPFAEFYAAAGLVGTAVFSVLFSSVIFILNHALLHCRTSLLKITISVTAAYVAFYIHRNSVATTLGLMRNFVWPVLFVYFLSILLSFARPKRLTPGDR